jgi:hypothetical protein
MLANRVHKNEHQLNNMNGNFTRISISMYLFFRYLIVLLKYADLNRGNVLPIFSAGLDIAPDCRFVFVICEQVA